MPETATTTEAQGSIAESRQKIQEYPTRTKPFHLPDDYTPRPYYVEEYSLSEEEYKRAFDKIVLETDEN